MLTAIVLNLVAIIVLVGGWALAVLALCQGLGDPYCRKTITVAAASILALVPSRHA